MLAPSHTPRALPRLFNPSVYKVSRFSFCPCQFVDHYSLPSYLYANLLRFCYDTLWFLITTLPVPLVLVCFLILDYDSWYWFVTLIFTCSFLYFCPSDLCPLPVFLTIVVLLILDPVRTSDYLAVNSFFWNKDTIFAYPWSASCSSPVPYRNVSCLTLDHLEVRFASFHLDINCKRLFGQGCPNLCTLL